jgi:outer membrane protein OmpA-like peptidoglycan-associated protein
MLCPGWQQRKDDIYAQDERHEYLDRLVRQNRGNTAAESLPPATVVRRIDTVTVPDILFASNAAELGNQSLALLDSLVAGIRNSQADSVVITGHTDSTGSEEKNRLLSLERAASVADHLRSLMPATLFSVHGKGSMEPVAGNDTPGGRQKNRRVEIYFYLRD